MIIKIGIMKKDMWRNHKIIIIGVVLKMINMMIDMWNKVRRIEKVRKINQVGLN